MTVVRTHRYVVDAADIEELCARRAALIAAVRANYSGLTRTVLTRLEDGTYTDSWYWDSGDHKRAAAPVPTMPEAGAALALVHERTDEDGEVLDAR